jgi:ribose transport system ATP-binding protein
MIMAAEIALEMRAITKRFPGVVALSAVSFDCRRGEIHAICGENGAGKSTLMNILGGNYRPDGGEIRLDGKPVRFRHPQQSRAAGVSIIYQELSLLPHRTVAENVFLGVEIARRGVLATQAMRARTKELLARIGSAIDPGAPVSSLSIASRQIVEIAKGLLLDARILVLDEPTAALEDRDAQKLFTLLRDLRQSGIAIVYISHRLAEVTEIADRITVLKDGAKVWTKPRSEIDLGMIVSAMVGRDLSDFYPKRPAGAPGAAILSVRDASNAALHDINLEVRAGEILGVGGLEDSGKAELARAIFGDAPFASGSIRIAGGALDAHSPRAAIAAGVGYLPSDRKLEGLAMKQSVRDNALLALHAMRRLLSIPGRGGLAADAIDKQLVARNVRAADFGQQIASLSGGNQQKVILCRWLAHDCRLLVCVEPTRGIDIAAKAAVYETMRAFADAGNALIVVSSDLPELIGVSDRLVVMHEGRIVGELPRGSTEEEIMRLSLGLGCRDPAGRESA